MDGVDRAVLEASHQSPRRRQDIGIELGLGPTGYHRRLNHLLDDPEALVAFRVVVQRLRRLRDQRRLARSARRLRG